jgi:hypothetical protein
MKRYLKSSRSRVSPDPETLCNYPYSDGRQCRMLRDPGHPSLCFFHSREERQQLELDRIGEDLASLSSEFHTMTEVRRAVAQLFKLVARNRIPLGNARLLAYLAQLLVYSQPDARQEIKFAFGHDGWNQTLRAAFSAPSGSDPAQFQPGDGR